MANTLATTKITAFKTDTQTAAQWENVIATTVAHPPSAFLRACFVWFSIYHMARLNLHPHAESWGASLSKGTIIKSPENEARKQWQRYANKSTIIRRTFSSEKLCVDRFTIWSIYFCGHERRQWLAALIYARPILAPRRSTNIIAIVVGHVLHCLSIAEFLLACSKRRRDHPQRCQLELRSRGVQQLRVLFVRRAIQSLTDLTYKSVP